MKRLATLSLILTLAAGAGAQEKRQLPDPAKIVEEARFSQAQQTYTMEGKLSRKFKKVPFEMVMDGPLNSIRFYFPNTKQRDRIISLVIKPNAPELTEQLKGQERKPLDPKRYGEAVQGTDVTYEDISQRFLYWPKPKYFVDEKGKWAGEDKFKIRLGVIRDAWVIRLDNPRRNFGPYGVVKVWIDKGNRALLRVEGFDWEGRKVKRFEVDDIRKDKGVWVISSMQVETIDQKGNRKDTTYMRMEAPK